MNGSIMKIAGEDALRQNIAETKRYIEEHGSSSGHTIVNSSGTEMTARSKLKFIGADISDDSTNDTTTVQISSSFNAMIDITTPSSVLYGATITVKKDGSTVDTTSFSNAGEAEYIAHSLGRYTFECTYGGKTYSSGEVVVVAQTLYETVIRAGLNLSEWITAGSTTDYPLNPSSYADFSALEADEAALFQLFTVHASVDYLATATAGDSLMQSVINSDVCAKWINLRDYALDTLSANSDIKDEMDTADKYGYGEWGIIDSTTTPPTWGALGNVPIMTANNAPYGVASGSDKYSATYDFYQAFSTDDAHGWTPPVDSNTHYIQYQSVSPICVRRLYIKTTYAYSGGDWVLSGSNDGTNFTPIKTFASPTTVTEAYVDVDGNDAYYLYHRITGRFADHGNGYKFQLYGRTLSPFVPTMTADNAPKGEVIYSTQYSSDIHAAWHVFVSGASSSWSPAASDSYGNAYVGYHAPAKCKALMAYVDSKVGTNRLTKYKIQASNDKFATTPVDVSSVIDNDVAKYIDLSSSTGYDDYRILLTQGGGTIDLATVYNIQFYGMDYSEKEFAQGSTRKTIYDHGVKPSGAITGGTDDGNNLTLSAVGTATVTIDKGTRTYMGGKAGLHASGTNRLKCGSGYSAFTASNMPDSNGFDISSISGSVAVGIEQTASGTFDAVEIWIE